MPKSTTAANNFLNLLYRAVAWANIADNATASPATNVFVRLHTGVVNAGDPGNTNEATYTGYAAVAIPRSTSGGFSAPSSGTTSNSAIVQFAECTAGTNVITHVSLNTAATGTGACLHTGALSAARTISAGIQGQFNASSLVVQET